MTIYYTICKELYQCEFKRSLIIYKNVIRNIYIYNLFNI